MSKELIEFALDTKEWGRILIARPIPIKDDPWGMLSPLQGTPWGKLIPVVDGEIMSHALHGHATPLMRVIGPAPKALLKQVPDPYRRCSQSTKCIGFNKTNCQPGPKLPECYTPPELPQNDVILATKVALAWREGRYVVVVRGVEFSY